jgi:glutathione S-transferase
MAGLKLISHILCPYVQRAVISMTEKNVLFERIDIDLGHKPEWFKEISPLGKTPVLRMGETSIFESAVILEYLEETQDHPLHPSDPLKRAEHRSWIEFGSALLNDIAGFYAAPDEVSFATKVAALAHKFSFLEHRLKADPYFDGQAFSLVDAAYGPVFRYFDTFDKIGEFGILAGKQNVAAWRGALRERPSIKTAVSPSYDKLLLDFLRKRNSFLSSKIDNQV